MFNRLLRLALCIVSLFAFSSLTGYQSEPAMQGHLADPFSAGWMLTDTNGDGIIDFIAGKVVVPARSSAAENAAAADLAARLGFGSTGFTPPIVIAASEAPADGPRIYVGRAAAPAKYATAVAEYVNRLQAGEGGVFTLDNDLIVLGQDDASLLAAAEAYAARAPYVWRPGGEKIAAVRAVCGAS